MIAALLILLSFFQPSAKAAQVHFQYCCPDQLSTSRAVQALKGLAIASDHIEQQQNCLSVTTEQKRVELLQKILQVRASSCQNSEYLVPAPLKEMCRIELEQKYKINEQETKVRLSQRSQWTRSQSKNQLTSKSFLNVTSGESGRLQFRQHKLVVKCTFITATRYRLELSFANEQPDKKTAVVSTVELTKGQRLSVASQVRDLNQKTLSTDIPNKYENTHSTGREVEDILISIK